MLKFENAKKENDEKHGDFFIELHGRVLGFEVYTPEENLSISTKKLKVETKNFIKDVIGRVVGESFGGGLSPNRFSESIERALANKAHQFDNKTDYPKILIINCYSPNSFNSVSSFSSEWTTEPKINNSYCSAIFVSGGFQNHYIRNPCAQFPLKKDEHEFVLAQLNKHPLSKPK